MQILNFEKKDENGKKIKVQTEIIKSWIDASGKSIYLKRDGNYCTKDDKIVRNLEALDILRAYEIVGKHPNGDPKTREIECKDYLQAKRWWETIGKQASDKFYNNERTDIQQLKERGHIDDVAKNMLPQAMYTRQPVESRGRKDVSAPQMFGAYFDELPPWWGYADMIEINGFRYRKDSGSDDFEAEVVNG